MLFDEAVEIVDRRDVFDARVIEIEQALFDGVDAIAAHAGEHRFDLLAQLVVMCVEAQGDGHLLAVDERGADEHLRGGDGIDLEEIDVLAPHLQAVKKHALRDEDAPGFEIPMGLAVFELAEMGAEFGDPVWVNLGKRARKELRGVHDLTGNDPRRLAAFVLAGLALAVFLAAFVEI